MSRSGTSVVVGLGLLVLSGVAVAGDGIYRCSLPDGGVEFRQGPCPGDGGDLLEPVPQLFSGRQFVWPRPRKRRLHDEEPLSRPGRRKRKSADRCWKTRQKISRIEWKLRKGYRPAEGERLRQRRREYEAYLNRFCR